MTEDTGPGPMEGLLSENTETLPRECTPEETPLQEEILERSIKDLLSETSLPGSDVLSPPPPPRKRCSLGIG